MERTETSQDAASLRLLTYEDLAEIAGVHVNTIRGWKRSGVLPPPVRISHNTVGWTVEEIRGWMASRREGVPRER